MAGDRGPLAVKYREAINEALRRALDEDEDVVLIGVDIGRSGGPFRVTEGLLEAFGPDRVIDAPIAEMGIMGLAVGAAIAGLRPVVELMYMDFLGVCLDPLLNQAAKAEFMSGGQVQVPLVVRTQVGVGGRAGAQHSQSLEAMLAGIPGLKVVFPSTVDDAFGLLASAIRDPGPVVVVENRRLYSARNDRLTPEDLQLVPLGRGCVRNAGADLTCVSYSRMVDVCLSAAEHVREEHGLSVEVIDLRTIQPWDREIVLDSVRKTSRLLVVHEATQEYGVGAEIASFVQEKAFASLDAPVMRLGAPHTPVPFSPVLEDAFIVSDGDVSRALAQLASW